MFSACTWSIVLIDAQMTANEAKMKTQMAIQSPEDGLEMHHKPCFIASKIDLNSTGYALKSLHIHTHAQIIGIQLQWVVTELQVPQSQL